LKIVFFLYIESIYRSNDQNGKLKLILTRLSHSIVIVP